MNSVLLVIKNTGDTIRKTFTIAIYSVRRRISDSRVICLFVLHLVFVWSNISVIGPFTKMVGVRVNPLLYPFLASDPVKQLIIFAGIVFLYSDAPFIDKSQPYLIIRSKRTVWSLGQILYVVISSAVYILILMSISVLIVLPDATFATNGWGQVVNTLAQTNAASQINLQFGVSEKIISLYSPLEAFVLCFLLNWGMASFLGLFIFAISLNLGRMAGMVISGIVLLLDLLVINSLPYSYFKFSPLSLSRLSVLDPRGISIYPGVIYAFGFYAVGIIIFSICIIASVRKQTIEISSES